MRKKIGIVGLGYVGVPLAVEFGKKFITVGYDTNTNRVNELKKGIGFNRRGFKRNLQSSIKLSLTSELEKYKKLQLLYYCCTYTN